MVPYTLMLYIYTISIYSQNARSVHRYNVQWLLYCTIGVHSDVVATLCLDYASIIQRLYTVY